MSDYRIPWIKCHPSFQGVCANGSVWPGPSWWTPMIMLYDEPTTGLDPVTSDEISPLINEVQKKYKTSSIIITHDIECAREPQTGSSCLMRAKYTVKVFWLTLKTRPIP